MATEKKETVVETKAPATKTTSKAAAAKAVAKADEAVKEAVKNVKTAAKKATAKKAPAKKTTTKAIAVNTHIQFGGKDLSEEAIVAAIKADWRSHGNKIADVKTIDVYVKPEDGKAYYVINDSFAESIDL